MSRIGRLPVAIPAGVEVSVAAGNVVTVKGPKGTLERALPTEMEIKVEDGHVVVTRPNDLKKMKALHGLTRSLIHNMVIGVSEGYTKELEVNGVGYKAAKKSPRLCVRPGLFNKEQIFCLSAQVKPFAVVSAKGNKPMAEK